MKQRGSALIISMMLIATVGAVAFGIAKLLFADTAISATYENGAVAYYAAESGIEEGFLRYKYNMNAEVPIGQPEVSAYWIYNDDKVSRTNLSDGTVQGGLAIGDADGNGEVNSDDLSILGLALGSVPSDSNWDARADFDGDGEVTSADLSIIGLNLGKLTSNKGISITEKIKDATKQYYDLRMGYLGVDPKLAGSGPFFYHDVDKDGHTSSNDIFDPSYATGDFSFLHIPKDEARTFDLSNIDFFANNLAVGFKFNGVGTGGYAPEKKCQAMAEVTFLVNGGTATAKEYKALTSYNPALCASTIGIDSGKMDAADSLFATGGYKHANSSTSGQGDTDYYYSLGNILSTTLNKAGATIATTDKVTMSIKPLYYSADIAFTTGVCNGWKIAGSLCTPSTPSTLSTLSLNAHSNIVTGPYTYMTSVGYFGGTTRTLTANIDRQSGTLYDLYRYVLFKGN